jgi:excisionase family DNA binding protein
MGTATVVREKPVERRWGTYRDAERVFGLSRWTVRALVEAGRVRAAKVGKGRGVRLSFSDLDAYMNEQAARPQEEKEG